MTAGWIATFGAPRGHRVRFLYGSYSDGNGVFAGVDVKVRTIECECGWGITYSSESGRQSALEEHARHVDAIRKNARSIGERDAAAELAAAELEQREHRDMLVDLHARPADDSEQRLAALPHPAELGERDDG